jgi:hypothetical protein
VIYYAFKNAARSAQIDGAGAGRLFDEAIARWTGGQYCHVETWLSGAINAARCYSARQPCGTGFDTIDLSDCALWRVVRVDTDPYEEAKALGYAIGGEGRPYNMAGIIGIGTDSKISIPWDRFCSQECFRLGTELFASMRKFASIDPLHVAPSGRPPGGYGMFELLTGVQVP